MDYGIALTPTAAAGDIAVHLSAFGPALHGATHHAIIPHRYQEFAPWLPA